MYIRTQLAARALSGFFSQPAGEDMAVRILFVVDVCIGVCVYVGVNMMRVWICVYDEYMWCMWVCGF